MVSAGNLPSEAFGLDAVCEHLPACVFVADPSGYVSYINRQARELTGRSVADMAGLRWFDVIHPPDRAGVQSLWTAAVRTGEQFEAEYRLPIADGSVAWFMSRAASIVAGDGTPRWVATCTEIDDRKCAEELLSANERWYRSTFEHAAVGVAHVAPDGAILAANDRLCALLARPRRDLLKTSLQDLTYHHDRGADADGRALLLGGEIDHYTLEKRFVRPDGSLVWGYLTVGLKRDDHGQPAHLIAFIEDITAHKARYDRLEQTLAAYKAVGWEWDPETNGVTYTGDGHKLLGKHISTAAEFFAAVHPDDRALVDAAVAEIAQGGSSYAITFRIIAVDGTERWVRDEASAFMIDGRRIVSGILRDVTAETIAKNKLFVQEERLRLAFAASRTAAWDWDLVSGKVVWAEGLLETAGMQDSGFEGTFEAFWDLVHEADKDYLQRELAAALAGEREYAVEFRMLRPDGSIRWTSTSGIVLRDNAGEAIRMVGVDADITERRLAEHGQHAARAFLQSVLDSNTDCVKVVELDGTLSYMNANGMRVMEIDDFALVRGLRWSALWPEPQRPLIDEAMAAAAAGETLRVEAPCPTAKGTDKWWDVAVAPIRDESGQVVRMVAVSRDITSAKHYEQQIASLAGLGDLAQRAKAFLNADNRALFKRVEAERKTVPAGGGSAGDTQSAGDQPENAQGMTEGRYAIAAAAASLGTWEYDPVNGVLHGDRHTRALFGLPDYGPVTWEGSFAATLHPDDRDRVLAAIDRAISGEDTDSYAAEYRVIGLRNGVERWISGNGKAFFAEGKPCLFIGTVKDITQRKRTEERLALLVEAAGRLLVAHDPAAMVDEVFELIAPKLRLDAFFHYHVAPGDSLELTASAGIAAEACRSGASLVFGQAVCGVVARDRTALYVPDVQGSDDPLHAFIKDQGLTSYACTPLVVGERLFGTLGFGRRNGERFEPGEIEFFGAICDYVAVALERARIEESLRQSERHARDLLDGLFVFVAVLSPDGRIAEVNRAPLEVSNLRSEAVVGRPFWDTPWFAHDAAQRAKLRDAIDMAMRGEVVRYDAIIAAADNLVTVDFQLCAMRDEHGRVTHHVASGVVVEDRVRAQAELKRLNAELEARVAERTSSLCRAAGALAAEMERREETMAQLVQAQKMDALGQLVGGVAHDFNNILAAIHGAFALLDRRVTDEKLKSIVDQGSKAASRATAVVRQMLAFARREPVRPEVVNLAIALPEIAPMISHSVGQQVDCSVVVADDVWPVLLDRNQLEVTVLNLAVNARDAMNGSGTLQIAARNLDSDTPRPEQLGAGDHVLITVTDSGCGMDEATAARVFEPFFTTKPRGEGTGLGLAQVHGFVAAASGAIAINSAPGSGTTVSLYLPRSAVDASTVLHSAVSPELHGNATILLADDDDQVRAVTAAYLRELGYVVIEAGGADAAIAMNELHPIDLLLTDVVMPGTDGVALVAALRALRPDLPVLYFTGYDGGHDLDGEAVVTKPFTADELSLNVLAALGRIRRRTALRLAVRSPDQARLLERLQHPHLRLAFERWIDCLHGRRVPDLSSFATAGLAIGSLAILKPEQDGPDGPVQFRVMSMGDDLKQLSGCPAEGQTLMPEHEELFGSLSAAYRTCMDTLAPGYDWCRYRFEEGHVRFERLILPFASDGAHVDHLIGFVFCEDIH